MSFILTARVSKCREHLELSSPLTHPKIVGEPYFFYDFFLIFILFVNCRVDQEISDRNSAESGFTTRIDKEIVDREDAISEIKSR